MTDQYTDPITEALMQQFLAGQTAQTNALNAIASRPRKEFQETKPLEYSDMLARRNQIGAERAMLNEALKQRETFGYGLANALASMPAQQGAGSWLGDFARGFGSAFNARANAAIDRAKQDYEAAQADLATALAFDKAMGEQQIIDYEQAPYVSSSSTKTEEIPPAKKLAISEGAATTLGDLYKTIDANPQAFSATGGIKQDAISKGLQAGVDVMGVDAIGKREFQYLKDLMPNGFATTINQVREQEIMRPYTTKFHNGRGSEKKATIKGMLGSIYDAYAADAAAQGFNMPISREEYIKRRIDEGREINAKWFSDSSTPMYKNSGQEKQVTPSTSQNWKKFMEGTK